MSIKVNGSCLRTGRRFFVRERGRQGERRATTGDLGVSGRLARTTARHSRRAAGRRYGAGAAGALALLLFATAGFAASPAAGASSSPAPSPFSPAPSASALPAPAASSTFAPGSGGRVYADNCLGCHGPRGEGLVGPPLAPAAFPEIVAPMVERGGISMPPFGGVLSDAQIQAVAGYVAGELSAPEARTAKVADGGQIYRLYCAGCHSTTGRGGALTRGPNAPNIAQYPAAEALAAMILGRGNMPAFAGNTLDVRQQAAVALYVNVIVEPPSPGGRGLGYWGPVPEGAVSSIALLLLILIAVWLAWNSRKTAP